MYLLSGGEFRLVNFQFEKISGYAQEELLGKKALRLGIPKAT